MTKAGTRAILSLTATVLCLGRATAGGEPGPRIVRLSAEPASIDLQGSGASHGLLISAETDDGRRLDVTCDAAFSSSDSKVAMVTGGRVQAAADGVVQITVAYSNQTASVPVTVTGTAAPASPSFRNEIVPVLTRYGCNQGGCHGKEAGQNGFKLSLRGFAPEEDYTRLTVESFGRRMNHASPDLSLVLAKASNRIPHRGGELFARDSRPYALLVQWIEAGTPSVKAGEETLVSLEILGGGRRLAPGQEQQLLVRGTFTDGQVRDLTWLSKFYSNDASVLTVSESGRVKAAREGASTIRAHFQDKVAVVAFTIPRAKPVDPALYEKRLSVVDGPVFDKLAELRIPPAPGCSDEEYLRRAFLDTIGTLPTAEEVVAFLADPSPGKRATLAEALLRRPEFVDYWAQILGELLQNRKERDHDVRGSKGVRAFHQWLREQVEAQRPWNELARDVLTVTGDTAKSPQIGYFVVTVGESREAPKTELVAAVAQSFLGTRILCCKCHNHPDEKYTQDDYYHFAAFFSSVSLERQKPEKAPTTLAVMSQAEQEQRKRLADLEKQLKPLEISLKDKTEDEQKKIQKQIDDKHKEMDSCRKRADEARRAPVKVSQPRTGAALAPQPLDRSATEIPPGEDPRKVLADWMTAPTNEYFSGSMVNRLWKHFLGVGLVDPVDDLRSSNPPSNAALWKTLNREFVESGFSLRHVMTLILTSRVYQLSAATQPENENDRRFYSHYYAKRMSAEVLLDAISQVTGVPDTFAGYPVGLRATQLPDPGVESHFLKLFGQSDRVTACACERSGEVTLPQLLHLQNGASVVEKIRNPEGRLASLLKDEPDAQKLAQSLFLSVLGRRPREAEGAIVARLLADGSDRGEVIRDLFWALLNSKEFVFNH
ncbi:MAG TPA: DUF1553 domain-containing protein [Planctomycetota bacterium]|nr:DUF1553 domain-containing protein [Planctomycetota bacterium]